MDDDDTPVIRPVLPSRAHVTQLSAGLPDPSTGLPPLPQPEKPDVPNHQKAVRSASVRRRNPSIKDPRRSAAAREAWKKRRKVDTPVGHEVHRDELGVLMQISALLEPLPAAKRKAVLTILQGLTS